jgi:hypothetical protein
MAILKIKPNRKPLRASHLIGKIGDILPCTRTGATYAGDINKSFEQSVMLGIAPYIGDYGDLHTWLMLHVEHKPAEQDNFTVTPMVRFFKGTNLVEVGISENGEAALNFIHRF